MEEERENTKERKRERGSGKGFHHRDAEDTEKDGRLEGSGCSRSQEPIRISPS
jgi:hypothetical protein